MKANEMILKEEFTVVSAYEFLNDKGFSTKEVEDEIYDLGADNEVIEKYLKEEYPNDFILVDFIEENTGSFHIRIFGEKEKPKEDERGIPFCSCGKPATWNFQDNWVVWEIGKSGFYERFGEENTGENLFYCDECAEKEGYI